MHLTVETHPLLDAAAFTTVFKWPLGETGAPDWLTDLLDHAADAPLAPSDDLRTDVRDMLRHGGFKPAGRNKPAAEYLARAASRGHLSSINPAVDACNVVSLHSGLPISVIDVDRASPPFRIAVADEEARYVFNPAGQERQRCQGQPAHQDGRRHHAHPVSHLGRAVGCRAHRACPRVVPRAAGSAGRGHDRRPGRLVGGHEG